MKKYIKAILRMGKEWFVIQKARNSEVNKFKAPRRVDIYKDIKLTKAQRDDIDCIYKKHYGKKIPYTWHRHYTAFTGNFDSRYFPELLYIPEFEYYMTPRQEYCYAFADKNVISMLAGFVGVKTPEVILSKTAGIFKDTDGNPLSLKQSLEIIAGGGIMFAKPSTDSCSGMGCRILEMRDGIDIRTGCSVEETLSDFGENFVIQKLVRCHESVCRLHPQSVNTFRVITYRWKTDIRCMPVIMRIGVGESCLDNAHAGGIFIAVEKDGTLHKTAFTEFNRQFTRHPDTDIRFEGYQIEHFERVLASAKKMHYTIPQVGVVNWDFTLDDTGEAVLIEANIRSGSIWLIEMAHGKGAFGDDTEEVLEWLRKIRRTEIDKRERMYFGKLGE